MKIASRRFTTYAWILLAYNFAVILWGVYVRASGSGAGCGAHWPLCNGVVIPPTQKIQTLIEFIHRVSSGFTLVLAAGLVIWAWRAFPKRHLLRLSSAGVFVFTISEAIIGAALVLLELVDTNASIYQVISLVTHLINTFLLLACLSLTAWWATFGVPKKIQWVGKKSWLLLTGILGIILIGSTGAVTALGDTLFPSQSFSQGMLQDFSPAANFLIRLRIIHPILAVTIGFYVLGLALWLRRKYSIAPIRQIGTGLAGVVVLQLGLGAINVLLAAPIWMQLLHLFVSDQVWIGLVLLSGAVLSQL
ncbi:MAG: COX15/CtaA family protein [Anaerolineaceae bacterium]|nr:COX15/CtaA family protein [Anaerolineaceae bacterium]